MASKKRKLRQKMKFDMFEDMGLIHDDDIDFEDISRDVFSAESGYAPYEEKRISARRQIERRRDMKDLYSELEDWEESGKHRDWS